jgi:hypothetical protein
MKKINLIALIVFSFTTIGNTADMETLKGLNFSSINFEKMAEIKVSPVKTAIPAKIAERKTAKLVNQDISYRFTMIASDLRRLKANTAGLTNDIRSMQNEAKIILLSGKADLLFQNDLRKMSYDISKHLTDAKRIHRDVKELLQITVKSEKLHSLAKNIEWESKTLFLNSQFSLQNEARNLLRTVLLGKKEIIGHTAKSAASGISKNIRAYSSEVKDIYLSVTPLLLKTLL